MSMSAVLQATNATMGHGGTKFCEVTLVTLGCYEQPPQSGQPLPETLSKMPFTLENSGVSGA